MGDTKNNQTPAAIPWRFLMVFLGIFFLASAILYIIDFVPEPVQDKNVEPEVKAEPFVAIVDVSEVQAKPQQTVAKNPVPRTYATAAMPTGTAEVPVRIVVKDVGVDTRIENPTASDITTLDNELLKGAVRYPGSAFLNENADVLLFGHQSYLPVVHNKAFKAFNDLQKLKEGAEIVVYSNKAEYRYRVTSVTLAHSHDGKVALGQNIPGLVLVTCNSLGAKEDRYIINAEFISRSPINS